MFGEKQIEKINKEDCKNLKLEIYMLKEQLEIKDEIIMKMKY
jgi:hypothetical protein